MRTYPIIINEQTYCVVNTYYKTMKKCVQTDNDNIFEKLTKTYTEVVLTMHVYMKQKGSQYYSSCD